MSSIRDLWTGLNSQVARWTSGVLVGGVAVAELFLARGVGFVVLGGSTIAGLVVTVIGEGGRRLLRRLARDNSNASDRSTSERPQG